jgi:ABC-type transport system involved in multi-copper enzyme maturation permease subunit
MAARRFRVQCAPVFLGLEAAHETTAEPNFIIPPPAMTLLPVIERELRVQARHAFTYGLRLLGVAALLAALVLLTLNDGLTPGAGGRVFICLHDVLLCAIWVLVPLSTSDCLSRERREDTLGLLLLTPLKARDIVLAKGLAHGLRALTLWLSALPVLVIPFLVGGLPWQSVALSCAINFSSIALALGASLLASSFCRVWHRSLALTMVLAVPLVLALGVMLTLGAIVAMSPILPGFSWGRFWREAHLLDWIRLSTVAAISGAGGAWTQATSSLPSLAQNRLMIGFGVGTAVSVLAAGGLAWVAAWNVRRRWREQSRSPRVEKLERIFCTPVVWRPLFHWWMRRKLERNPIGWLEQRKWSSRLVMWNYSLAKTHFLSAFFWTLLMGCFFPLLLANTGRLQELILLAAGARLSGPARAGVVAAPVIFGSAQILLAMVFGRLLNRNLEQRRFALESKPV